MFAELETKTGRKEPTIRINIKRIKSQNPRCIPSQTNRFITIAHLIRSVPPSTVGLLRWEQMKFRHGPLLRSQSLATLRKNHQRHRHVLRGSVKTFPSSSSSQPGSFRLSNTSRFPWRRGGLTHSSVSILLAASLIAAIVQRKCLIGIPHSSREKTEAFLVKLPSCLKFKLPCKSRITTMAKNFVVTSSKLPSEPPQRTRFPFKKNSAKISCGALYLKCHSPGSIVLG